MRGRGMSTSYISAIRPGPRRHDCHAIGEEYRFGDRMRYECDCLARLHPDFLDQQVHFIAREGIKGAERLVHRSTEGSTARLLTIEARCCMPPDSSRGYFFSKPASETRSSNFLILARSGRFASVRREARYSSRDSATAGDWRPGRSSRSRIGLVIGVLPKRISPLQGMETRHRPHTWFFRTPMVRGCTGIHLRERQAKHFESVKLDWCESHSTWWHRRLPFSTFLAVK